ncbi:hypothetical protein ACFLUB_01695 [Chloroflexota bacterium]
MSRKDSIKALLSKVEAQITEIEAEYNKSLHARAISATLRIEIKNACENMRSVLDYLAHEIHEHYSIVRSSKGRIYFPICPDQKTFDITMDRYFPQLRKKAPIVFSALEAVQPFQTGQVWFGQFNILNNENKHGDLVEQTRVERQETRVTSQGGGQVAWTQGVKFGRGVSVMGVPIDPSTQLPIPHPSIKVEKITWVDFQFDGIGVSAIGLIKKALAGIKSIETTLRPLL